MAFFPREEFLPLFSPEGRLYAVEYAIEEVVKALPAVAILANDGIVTAAELEGSSSLIIREGTNGNIFRINDNNACVITGIKTDAYKLKKVMNSLSQRHLTTYGELMPTEQLVEQICRKKQSYTMFTGKHPFGISVIYMGWDLDRGFQLFQSDPSGNYNGWKSVCIGRNAYPAQYYLEDMLEGKPLPDLSQALELAIKTLKMAMGTSNQVSGTTVQMATLKRKNNMTDYNVLSEGAVQELCNLYCGSSHSSVTSYFGFNRIE